MQALVLDDSRAMRRILSGILGKLGFQVAESGNGFDALVLLRRMTKPVLVLVDWNMPEMDGVDFVRAVRADPELTDVRIVMVTTETEAGRIGIALEAGADEYVMKPFTREMIAEKLELLGVVAC